MDFYTYGQKVFSTIVENKKLLDFEKNLPRRCREEAEDTDRQVDGDCFGVVFICRCYKNLCRIDSETNSLKFPAN